MNFATAVVQSSALEVSKSQAVRLLDVLAIGPFIIWAATQTKGDFARAGLFAVGIATVLYNAHNYLSTNEANENVQPY
jgi:hypothetical protein